MADPVRFHLSLNVSDLPRSVAFFRTLFGLEPAKVRPDYAKFEPDDPPLVLSLEPAKGAATGGALNHLGFRLPDAKALVAMQERLERAGLRTRREEGVECCYAKQTKFWAHDPDGNLWEVYTFDGDIDHRGAGQAPEAVLSIGGCAAAIPAAVWEHRMNEPVPSRIPLADGVADEVRLRGTLNLPLSAAEQNAIVAEAARVLRPGGRLFVHVLTGDRPVEDPHLPGPAAAVRSVPPEADPITLVEAAGFVCVRMIKFDAKPCFLRDGVAMRELQLEGFAPEEAGLATVEVMYKGPFREVRDDEGRVYVRGRRLAVPVADMKRLRASDRAEEFVFFASPATLADAVISCGY